MSEQDLDGGVRYDLDLRGSQPKFTSKSQSLLLSTILTHYYLSSGILLTVFWTMRWEMVSRENFHYKEGCEPQVLEIIFFSFSSGFVL